MHADPETLGFLGILRELFNTFAKEQKIPISKADIDMAAPRILNTLKNDNVDIKKYISEPQNQEALKKAFLFVAVSGKDPDFKDTLKSILTPGNKNFPHPEMKIGKRDLIELLLIQVKKKDPQFKQSDAKKIATELKDDEVDNALTDLINLMGFDPTGKHPFLSPQAGVTNIRHVTPTCPNKSFKSALENEFEGTVENKEMEDNATRIASEELSPTEIQQDNLENAKKEVKQVEVEVDDTYTSPTPFDSMKKGPRPE